MSNRSTNTEVIAASGLPLSFRVAPLQQFLEVGLAAGQPITAVEVQLLETGTGPATLVLVHRPDRTIDVAVSDPGLDKAWFDQDPCMCHMRLGRIETGTFYRSVCRITERSVEVDVSLDTGFLAGRLEIVAEHNFSRPGFPSFVPAVPGVGERPTLRFIMAGAVRGLPRSAEPTIILDSKRLETRPLAKVGPIVLARPARMGSDVLGIGLNLSGTIGVPASTDGAESDVADDDDPVELTATRGQHRLALRLLTASGEPLRKKDLPTADTGSGSASGTETGISGGQFVIDGSLGPVAGGSWQLEPDQSGMALALDDVVQRWTPRLTDPLGVAQYLARRRRRTGERWRWDGRWTQDDGVTDRHSGQWTARGAS